MAFILKRSTAKQHIQFEDYNILAPANVVIREAHYDAGGGREPEDGTNHR
jgi:hypothetical protein